MKKMFLGLMALFLSGFTPIYSQVKLVDAQQIYESIHHLLGPRLAQKNIEVLLDIKETKFPGAYARWERHLKVGVLTLSPDLLEMPELSEGTLALLICHEFGHFLGGAPFITQNTDSAVMARMMRNPFQNLSVEGQADFFATSSCYREIVEKEKSAEQMKTDLDQLIVVFQRLMIMQDIHVSETQPHRDTPSIARASVTMSRAGEYPTLQCRLDTLLRGLQCTSGIDDESGECLDVEVERPACWYKQQTAD